jgi:twitching motility protein PilT
MSLVPSLLQAIVGVDGEALVMHAGDKPYVVAPSGQIELASRGLTLEAVNGIVSQLLPPDALASLDEFGAIQQELRGLAEFPGESFTVVAARGGDDVWVEIRRRKVPDDDQVPDDFFEAATAKAVSPAPEDGLAHPNVAVREPAHNAYTEIDDVGPLGHQARAEDEWRRGTDADEQDELLDLGDLAVPEAALLFETPAPTAARMDEDVVDVPEPSVPVAPVVTPPPTAVVPPPVAPTPPAPVMTASPVVAPEPVEPPKAPPFVAPPPAPAAPPPVAAVPVVPPPVAAAPVAPPPVQAPAPVAPPPIAPPPAPRTVGSVEPPVVTPPPVAPPVPASPVAAPSVAAPSVAAPSVAAPSVAAPPVAAPPSVAPPAVAPPAPAPPPPAVAPPPVLPPIVAPPIVSPPPFTPPMAISAEPPFRAPAPQPAVVLPLSRSPIRTDAPPPPIPVGVSGLDRLLRMAAARGASTLYLSSNARPSVRVDGEIQMLEGEPSHGPNDVESLLLTLVPDRNHEALRSGVATEWISDVDGVGRVRCLSFRDHRGPGGVFRMMPVRAVSAEQLGLSSEVQSLALEAGGLVLVAGSRLSGKRTMISALVDLINHTRRDHVITIESEINVVHERGTSFISQREVRGSYDDVEGVARAALREDPDVLVVESMRTAPLINVALEAAGSGQLVIGGFPAHNTTAAVDRIINLYPPENRRQMQLALAENLRGIVAQVLLRKTGGGRLPAREVLLNTPAVAGIIAEGRTSQLPAAIEGGRRQGMLPLNDALAAFVQSGSVDVREAHRRAADRPGFLALLKRLGMDTTAIERMA